MDRPKFVIEPTEAESMANQLGLTVLELLPSLVKPAQSLARPPISKYHVGAVGLGSSGRIFLGVNLEFPGLPLHHSVHAEQFLVTNLYLNAESNLRYVAVSSAPCGHCRQFFQEIRGASDINVLVTSDEPNEDRSKFRPLSYFLPHRFGPDDLLDKDEPLLLEPHRNGLSLLGAKENCCSELCNGDTFAEELKRAALDAANRSHAPYSRCPSGVALIDCEGKVYKGSYLESAAYNPSFGPVQAAIVDYVANGFGGGYERIVGAVLVEKEDSVVRQEHTARLILQLISPKCTFKVFHCC
ncbi:cytidine deaminase 1 [Carica papaya]|uniref:cytidine deaminase 1 n=1 Tax=Carica papaya TaxID=3649 RepID=UPI000B8D0AD5|nr:cytidine deaminase 1 [Carica papaya]